MRLIDILSAPRYATSASTRWFGAGLYVVLAGAAVAIGIAAPDPKAQFMALVCYACGIGCLWMLWLSGMVLLARDGWRLGLPGVARNSVWATWVYAFAMVAPPALLTAATGGNVAMAVLYPALALAGGLGWMLLPRWLAMWFGFLPAIYIGLHNGFQVPSPLDPRFQHWAWLTLAVLGAIVLVRWRQLARSEDNDDSRWSSAMILQMRRHAVNRDWWSMDRNWAWRRARGRKTDVDFHGLGVANPVLAIRIALGGWYVPQSWRSRLGTLARVVLPLLLFIPVMVLMNLGHAHSLEKTWKIIGLSGGLWVGLFGTAMLALGVASLLQRRWRSAADMALLALLPGMGGGAAKQHVLRAALRGPVISFVVLWFCTLTGIALAAPRLSIALLASLFVAEMAALMVMAALHGMAGVRMSLAAKVALGVVLIVLTDAGFVLASAGSASPWHAGESVNGLMLLAWCLLLAWTTWRARLAWQALRCRPHPFLANLS